MCTEANKERERQPAPFFFAMGKLRKLIRFPRLAEQPRNDRNGQSNFQDCNDVLVHEGKGAMKAQSSTCIIVRYAIAIPVKSARFSIPVDESCSTCSDKAVDKRRK